MPYSADAVAVTPELIDRSLANHDGVVYDVALTSR